MASNLMTNGYDLDTVFAAYASGTKAATTGIRAAGQDLKDRYQPGSTTALVGYKVSGVDISTMFQFLAGGPADPGGPGGTCVCDGMFIRAGLLARDAVPGDVFDCLDMPTSGMQTFQRPLSAVEHRIAACVRLTTDSGAVLECSETTPFDLPDGRQSFAPLMLGELVVTDRGMEKVVSVEALGTQRICRNHIGGLSYAAGADPTHRIYSHNSLKF